MLKESSNKHSKTAYPDATNNPKDKMVCKDGFCSLPIKQDNSKQNKNDLNLFDPV